MLLSTIFTSLVIPIQVHPMTHSSWQNSQAPMVQAAIDTARIIGLPRMWTLDKPAYINEIHPGPIYLVNPRRAFIQKYLINYVL